jgi:NTP pyrophosphatase (non-canonical NTP hydrolase)
MDCYEISKSKGWHETGKTIPEFLCLIHSEVSEALEDYREHGAEDWDVRYEEDKQGNPKPEGFGIELADVLIRVFDLAEAVNIDMELMLRIKMAYNKTRPYRHGGKYL